MITFSGKPEVAPKYKAATKTPTGKKVLSLKSTRGKKKVIKVDPTLTTGFNFRLAASLSNL